MGSLTLSQGRPSTAEYTTTANQIDFQNRTDGA